MFKFYSKILSNINKYYRTENKKNYNNIIEKIFSLRDVNGSLRKFLQGNEWFSNFLSVPLMTNI